jgi:hypothetical protein
MNIEIKESMYNKTTLAEDGITQIVDTDHTYKCYKVDMQKIYFIDNEIEMLKQLRNDLEELCNDVDEEIGYQYKLARK